MLYILLLKLPSVLFFNSLFTTRVHISDTGIFMAHGFASSARTITVYLLCV